MSDYTKTTNFTAKDSLSTGDPDKLIKGSLYDTEFDAIATAVATKYDVNDLASQAQAEAETANTVLMTPLRVANWADANGGMVGDIQALTDPNADRLLFWDDSAGAAALLAVSTGLTLSGTTLTTNDAAIVHDSLSGFVADEHVAHSGVTLTAGAGLTGGGTIAASRSFAVGAGDGISVAADAVAVDSTVVRTTGAQTIGGAKTFSADIALSGARTIDGTTSLTLTGPTVVVGEATGAIGFYSATFTSTKQTITGATISTALQNLLAALDVVGLITDNTTF